MHLFEFLVSFLIMLYYYMIILIYPKLPIEKIIMDSRLRKTILRRFIVLTADVSFLLLQKSGILRHYDIFKNLYRKFCVFILYMFSIMLKLLKINIVSSYFPNSFVL